jgi:hypothetical protein
MSRLEFPKWRKVPQFLPQQAVQLETLMVAIQHPQQRRIDKLIARIAPFRFRETGDLHCERKPASLDRADGHRIEQPLLLLGPRGDGAPQQSGDVVHFVAQSFKPQPARRPGHGIKLAPHVGADDDRDRQALDALRKLKQRFAMFFGGFIAEIDSENRLRLVARKAFDLCA